MVALIDMVKLPGLTNGRSFASATQVTGLVDNGTVELCASAVPEIRLSPIANRIESLVMVSVPQQLRESRRR